MTVRSKWINATEEHVNSEENLQPYIDKEINNIQPSTKNRGIDIISITSYLDYIIVFYEEYLISSV